MIRPLSSVRQFAYVFALMLSASVGFSQLAFPGALGFGAAATGGRSGTVYHVTNLNNSGTGSFRDAVSTGNRIVVFDVGGYISLSTAVSVSGNNITIAGQTAPGGGIGFKGGEISFAGRSNIVCRFIRIRPGSDTASTTDDALSLYRARDVICDHVSFEFGPWNNIDGVSDNWQLYQVTDITFQNCIIADPTGQQFGAHTECVNGNWSWFYNVFANTHNRNPLAKVNNVFVNNVLYNHQAGYTTHTSTKFSHDIVNNYFILGPGSGGTDNTWFQVDKNQSIYYSGNLEDANKDGVLNGSATTPYWYQGPGTILSAPWSPMTTNATIYSPATAFSVTLSQAGALPRDEVDSLIMSQMKTLGSGTTGGGAGTAGPGTGLYTSQTQTGLGNNGYGTISGGTAPTDTDQDGLPDFWETAVGSSPSTDSHTTLVPVGAYVASGYTLLDEYLHFLSIPHTIVAMDGSVDVDLRQYTAGFYKAPVTFILSNATNGTATMQPDGYTVHFVPTASFVGRARVDFQVTDSDGKTLTQTLAVLASGSLVPPTAPSGLTATAISSSKIVASWTDTSATESGFKIESSTNSVNFSEIGEVDANTTSFTNTVAPSTTYYYRVRAYNLVANSAYSNTNSAATPAGPPAVPAAITATPANSRVNVSWSTSPGATSYKLRRSAISGSGFAVIANTSATVFTDSYVTNGATYYYVVSALNGSGESTNSTQASATPSSAITYQAEDALLTADCTVDNNHVGYHGIGFVNAATNAGSGIEWDDLDAGGGGSCTLSFRYALGKPDRTAALIVNGVTSSVTFTQVDNGIFTNWVNKDVVATLNPGISNIVQLESTGADLANMDELSVFGTALPPPPASPMFGALLATAGSLLMSGSNGAPFGNYYVLTATNVSQPVNSWTRMVTNAFDAAGNFSYTKTNPTPGFFRLQLP